MVYEFKPVRELLTLLETTTQPLAAIIYKESINFEKTLFDKVTSSLLFSKLWCDMHSKWSIYKRNYPTILSFKSIRIFDPRQSTKMGNLQSLEHQTCLKPWIEGNEEILLNEYSQYCKAIHSINFDSMPNFDLSCHWQSYQTTFPHLTALAIRSIWLPVSSVEVERSFSKYREIFSERRRKLSPAAMKVLSALHCNITAKKVVKPLV